MNYDIFNIMEASAPPSFALLFFAIGVIVLFLFGGIFGYLSDRFKGASNTAANLAVFVFVGPFVFAGFGMTLASMAGFIVRLLRMVL